MNINLLKVHCSKIHSIMANARDNKPLTEKEWEDMRDLLDRDKPLTDIQIGRLKDYVLKETSYDPKKLSGGIKSDLIKLYSYYVYGKKSIKDYSYDSLSLEKGTTQEWQSIKLLSDYDCINYKKNEVKYSNRFITGVPDIVVSRKKIKKVVDTKTPIDINSFLNKHEIQLSTEYLYQMRGYIELTKADYGEVAFCLVNLPPEMIAQEVRKLKAKFFLIGKSDEETERRVIELQDSMIFDDIPIERKIIKFTVHRDEEFMKAVYERVKIARSWMKEFHKKSAHL